MVGQFQQRILLMSGRKARAAMLRRAKRKDTAENWNKLVASIEASHAAKGKTLVLPRREAK